MKLPPPDGIVTFQTYSIWYIFYSEVNNLVVVALFTLSRNRRLAREGSLYIVDTRPFYDLALSLSPNNCLDHAHNI